MLKEAIYDILANDTADLSEIDAVSLVNSTRLLNSDMTVTSTSGIEHYRYSLKTLMNGGTDWGLKKIFFDRSVLDKNTYKEASELPIIAIAEDSITRIENGSGKDYQSVLELDILNMTEVPEVYKSTQSISWRVVYVLSRQYAGAINPGCKKLTDRGLEWINRIDCREISFEGMDRARINATVAYTII